MNKVRYLVVEGNAADLAGPVNESYRRMMLTGCSYSEADLIRCANDTWGARGILASGGGLSSTHAFATDITTEADAVAAYAKGGWAVLKVL